MQHRIYAFIPRVLAFTKTSTPTRYGPDHPISDQHTLHPFSLHLFLVEHVSIFGSVRRSFDFGTICTLFFFCFDVDTIVRLDTKFEVAMDLWIMGRWS